MILMLQVRQVLSLVTSHPYLPFCIIYLLFIITVVLGYSGGVIVYRQKMVLELE